MDESVFARELNKYRVVRRPEFVGASSQKGGKRTETLFQKQPKSVKLETELKAEPVVPIQNPAMGFWELLEVYVTERGVSKVEAEKLISTAKIIFEKEKANLKQENA